MGDLCDPGDCAFIPARISQSFAWNHGDIQDEIASTWAGYVGPGVESTGVDSKTWSDHTDLRPTILNLVGLKDDYVHDGRVISEVIENRAIPLAVKISPGFTLLAQTYKQLNAPLGSSHVTLRASTKALASNDPGDATYNSIEGKIQSLTTRRDSLATEIKGVLDGAEFNGQPINTLKALVLVMRASILLGEASVLPH